MDSSDYKILDTYFKLIDRLSFSLKLALIERLVQSMQKPPLEKNRMHAAFGAWESDDSVENQIAELRSARQTNRQIERF